MPAKDITDLQVEYGREKLPSIFKANLVPVGPAIIQPNAPKIAQTDTGTKKRASIATQGSEVKFPDVEPWPEPVSGEAVLNEVSKTFGLYTVLPAGAADVIALWCAHVHVFRAFLCSPRLNIQSPEKGCGKTTLRDVVAQFVPRPLQTENLTTAVLFRLVEAHAPAILADEYDSWLGNNEELRGLLNSGHRRGAMVYRCDGDKNEVRAFAAFAPAVLCGIGALPGTLHDRSIVIRLERAKPGELHTRFDSRHIEKEQELCRKLARFTSDNFAQLTSLDPVLPDGAFNRVADNWRPLFAIAEIAGGDWPKRIKDAFAKLTAKTDVDDDGIGTMLLSDIRDILGRMEVSPIPGAEIVKELILLEGRPWSEFDRTEKPITTTKLTKMLKRFQISSSLMRDGSAVFRGYDCDAFNEAFARYLPAKPLPP